GTLLKLALDSPAVAHNGILAVDPWFLTLLVLAIRRAGLYRGRRANATPRSSRPDAVQWT
ncbi:hypothetical protein C7E18_22370, partial [Stenotrophomonas maltophilia]